MLCISKACVMFRMDFNEKFPEFCEIIHSLLRSPLVGEGVQRGRSPREATTTAASGAATEGERLVDAQT